MRVLTLLRSGAEENLGRVIGLSCLAGLGNILLIAMVNQAAERVADGVQTTPGDIGLYLLAFGGFHLTNRLALAGSNAVLQARVSALRDRVAEKIDRAPLRSLEHLGQGDLIATLTQETNLLSRILPLFVGAIQGALILVFCLLYLAALSPMAFLIVAVATLGGLTVFHKQREALDRALQSVHGHGAAVIDTLVGVTKGFQEIRLNADKSDALFARHRVHVSALEDAMVNAGGHWATLLQFTNAFLYVLVGAVIFALPVVVPGFPEVMHKVVAIALFCIGPVAALTAAAQMLAKAEVGLGHVADLEARLDRAAAPTRAPVETSRFRGFTRIDLENILFHYMTGSEVLFASGPWSLSLGRSEILFFTGGNGAGKSTAMKLLCGLYDPDGGTVSVDGGIVGPEERQHYRELFSTVFADFHLFDRPHGLDNLDPDRVAALIDRMDLTGKVSFREGRFSTLALSTGQRKRLALIVALLEDREILVFDEWAADQDPHFRAFFYDTLLPDLRDQGKTILAVTHDDRFWSLCDRRIHMDLGSMAEVSPKPSPLEPEAER